MLRLDILLLWLEVEALLPGLYLPSSLDSQRHVPIGKGVGIPSIVVLFCHILSSEGEFCRISSGCDGSYGMLEHSPLGDQPYHMASMRSGYMYVDLGC